MKVTFPASSKIDRRVLGAIFALTVVLVAGLGGLVTTCGGTEITTTVGSATPTALVVSTTAAVTTTTQAVATTEIATITTQAPTTTTGALVPMSAAEISQWKTDATAFVEGFYGAFPDANAMLVGFADDATFYDPCNGDFLLEGKQGILGMMRDFNAYAHDRGATFDPEALYLSGNGAASSNAMENLWPPWTPEPADIPTTIILEVFRFKDGQVASYDIWNEAPSLELVSCGCFAPGKGGSEQLQAIADKYLAAWASGDKARIAALYHEEAVFSDTMLGLQAQGPAAIAELFDKRFGSDDTVTFEIVNLYVQTNGYPPPTEDQPELGAIIAVGIHYLCNLVVQGKPATIEGLTTFDLGTLQGTVVLDPNGLITREEVFYDADSLLASELVQ
jgi:ketosteroid isomerase-like protein